MSKSRRRLKPLVLRGAAISIAAAMAGVALGTPALAQDPQPTTIVSLTFDDGTQDQFDNARPLLRSHGMRGTFFVNNNRIGGAGFMSEASLATLQSEGDEIGGHTIDHADLLTLSADDQRRELCNDRVALLNRGLDIRNVAYPYGNADATTRQIAAECGYNSGRTIGGIACPGCDRSEHLPPIQQYYVRTPNSVRSTTTLATLQGYVTQAENDGGGWIALAFHHVCESCGDVYSVTPPLFGQFLDWLSAREGTGTVVRTVDEVIGGQTQAAVPGPELPAPLPGSSVVNPSLESVGAGGVPACFKRSGYGTSTYTWERVSAGHTGTAQQVTVTSHTSGDRKLVTAQDSSSCVPAAVPGHTYAVSLWYRGTWQAAVVVKLTMYYRTAAGTWVYWTSGPALPATSGWATTPSYTTPAVPAGATGLSFGIALAGVGQLATDDYSLVDTSS
ncbi:MAG: polysaccharide deacetylase family protein [Micromonosporaceae bacterium]|nr:polysaccharide deacetylase family protein [Micromonosporaceae bacterium]